MNDILTPPSPPARVDFITLTLMGFGVGVFMVAGGVFLAVLQELPLDEVWYPLTDVGIEVSLGIIAGSLGAMLATFAARVFPPLRALGDKIIPLFDWETFRWWYALLLGLVAGLPEEILFRGALQPILGVILTGILFGSLHALTRLYMVYATGAGLLLGLLVLWRGNLWAATFAHIVYDMILFWVMSKHSHAQTQ